LCASAAFPPHQQLLDTIGLPASGQIHCNQLRHALLSPTLKRLRSYKGC